MIDTEIYVPYIATMNSVSPKCQQLKEDYDKCFNHWFTDKYLKGVKKEDCIDVFRSYQSCVKDAIKEKGINISENTDEIKLT
ncbi:hypothetical protein LSH36_214g00003 [Paralvinella palmiformis]|uniref:TP53-regulated inhibitor of apoptosis 1 n=1 Tax=Paralvinella palmiformis TaxID=53620 RepID=A0AAD9N4G4_9ANNE|nr:hypothetical protein LSH36_214g00003 [Paralvinella palmiformis]